MALFFSEEFAVRRCVRQKENCQDPKKYSYSSLDKEDEGPEDLGQFIGNRNASTTLTMRHIRVS
jgi:hypothetical protein